MKIIDVQYRQQNDYYNSETCHNGGGYDQPLITVEFDDGITIVIDDTSCGDFGNRVSAYVYMGKVMLYSACWGSMCSDSERGSDIPWSDRLQMVFDETGYAIMYAEEWADLCRDEEDEYWEEF